MLSGQQAQNKEIVASTIQNYLKSINLSVNWHILKSVGKGYFTVFPKEKDMQMTGYP